MVYMYGFMYEKVCRFLYQTIMIRCWRIVVECITYSMSVNFEQKIYDRRTASRSNTPTAEIHEVLCKWVKKTKGTSTTPYMFKLTFLVRTKLPGCSIQLILGTVLLCEIVYVFYTFMITAPVGTNSNFAYDWYSKITSRPVIEAIQRTPLGLFHAGFTLASFAESFYERWCRKLSYVVNDDQETDCFITIAAQTGLNEYNLLVKDINSQPDRFKVEWEMLLYMVHAVVELVGFILLVYNVEHWSIEFEPLFYQLLTFFICYHYFQLLTVLNKFTEFRLQRKISQLAGTNQFHLLGAKGEVIIAVLEQFINKSTRGFWERHTLERMKETRNLYRAFCSNANYTTEECANIKEKLKHLSLISDDELNIITDCSQVHVVSLAVSKDREGAANEIESIKQMSERMGYTIHGPLDISDSEDLIFMLQGTLLKIKNMKPQLILVFTMGHGSGDRIFGYMQKDKGVHVSKIIETVDRASDNNVLKYVYIQTCRTAENAQAVSGTDPNADFYEDSPERISVLNALEEYRNMYVHMATKPQEIAYRDTFISFITKLLSATNCSFIKPYEASIKASKKCKMFFSEPRLYCTPDIDVICEIQVPPWWRQFCH